MRFDTASSTEARDARTDDFVFWSKDLAGRYIEASPTFGRFFGLQDNNSPIGHHDRELFPPHLANLYEAGDRRALLSGTPQIVEESYWHGWIESVRMPVFDAAGQAVSINGFARDVTERHRNDLDELRQLRNFQTLLEHSPKLILRFDRQGRLYYRNPAAAAFSGRAAPQEIGRPIEEHGVLPPEQARQLGECIAWVTTTGETREAEFIWEYEESCRQLQVRIVPEFDGFGGIDGAMVIGRDVSAVRQARIKLRKSHELLRALAVHYQHEREQERRDISQRIHEDLAQQLAALRMHLMLLLRRHASPELTSEVLDICEIADRSIAKLRDMVVTLRPTVLDLGIAPALRWLAADFHKGLNMPVEVFVDDDLDVDDATTTFLFRATQEALINIALHAAATSVAIHLEYHGTSIRLRIRDNGRGFPQGQPPPDDAFGLLGISEQAQHFGGHLDIDSRPEHGTTLSIVLPRTTQRESAPTPTEG